MSRKTKSDGVVKGRTKRYRIEPMKVRLVKDGAAVYVGAAKAETLENASKVFEPFFRGLPHEEVFVALLDAGLGVRGIVRVSQGGLLGTSIEPSELFRIVLAAAVPCFIIAHNHPSGNPEPSMADVKMTRIVLEGARLLGLDCVDHVICGGGRWVSLRSKMPHDFKPSAGLLSS